MLEPLAITGLGCLSALGGDIPATQAALLAGVFRPPAPPRRFTTDHPHPFPVFEIPDTWANPANGTAGRCALLAREAARQALAQAQLDPGQCRIGVSLGTVAGDPLIENPATDSLTPGIAALIQYAKDSPACFVGREFSLQGPCQVITTACTSGSVAIAQGAAWVRSGTCDTALVGGAERLTRICYNGFAALMLADPQPCRPFDRTRAGLNLGEGAGVLLLERAATARARGAEILGWLLGDGNASDAYNLARPHPDGAGLTQAITTALQTSALEAADLSFINANGTGTLDNDLVEARVFSRMLAQVPFLSTKGLTGHTLGAAGGIEAVLTVLCLAQRHVPASCGFSTICPDCSHAPLTSAQTLTRNYAMSTSVGYGGSNTALIFAAPAGGPQ